MNAFKLSEPDEAEFLEFGIFENTVGKLTMRPNQPTKEQEISTGSSLKKPGHSFA
jgi:hypothetical protein